MSTFPSNPNSIPNNLGIPYPPITLRRNAGRTPGHRARRNSLRSPLRKAVRNLPRRVWRRATRAPGRDTGHTTRHHPEPTPTSTNTPHHSTPEKYAGKARGWVGGEGRAPKGDEIGATGTLPSPPSFLYSPRKRTKAANRSSTLSGLVTAQKTTNPAPLSASAPQHRFSGALSTVVTVTVSTRPTSRPRRPYDRVMLSVRETSKPPLNSSRPLNISVTSIKLLNNYSCSHLNYNKIAHTLQAFHAITAGQPHNQGTPRTPTTPRHPQYQQPETQTGAEERAGGEGPQRWGRHKPHEINPKPLDTRAHRSRVMGVGQGTSLPSTTKWAPSGCSRRGPRKETRWLSLKLPPSSRSSSPW